MFLWYTSSSKFKIQSCLSLSLPPYSHHGFLWLNSTFLWIFSGSHFIQATIFAWDRMIGYHEELAKSKIKWRVCLVLVRAMIVMWIQRTDSHSEIATNNMYAMRLIEVVQDKAHWPIHLNLYVTRMNITMQSNTVLNILNKTKIDIENRAVRQAIVRHDGPVNWNRKDGEKTG